MKKLPLVVFIIVVVLAFAIILWQYVMVSSDGPREPLSRGIEGRSSLDSKKESQIIPRESVVLHEIGEVDGYAEGRISYHQGEFLLILEADLPEPLEGEFYAGWLIREKPFAFMKLGEMEKNRDGLFSLSYSSNEDLRDHKKVSISIEKVRDDKPDKNILEGSY